MKWRIVHKLTLASVLMVFLTLLAGGVGLWQVLVIGQVVADMREAEQQQALALELRALSQQLVANLERLLHEKRVDLIRTRVVPTLDALVRLSEDLQTAITDPSAARLLQQIQQTHDELANAVDRISSLADQGQWSEVVAVVGTQARLAQERHNIFIRQLVHRINLRTETVSAQAERATRQAAILLVGLLLLTTSLAVGWRQLVFQQMGWSIALLRQGVARISGGDLAYELEIHTGDEIEELSDEFNEMARSLQASRTQLERWGHDLETSVAERTQELQKALEEQRRLSAAIQEMSTPVVPVHAGVIVMPLVGAIDASRTQQIVSGLLEGVENHDAQVAIVDVTGIPVMSSEVVSHLMEAARAVRLLGAQAVLVGITPEVAKTIIDLGVDLAAGLVTRSDLQAGIEYALGTMGLHVTQNGT